MSGGPIEENGGYKCGRHAMTGRLSVLLCPPLMHSTLWCDMIFSCTEHFVYLFNTNGLVLGFSRSRVHSLNADMRWYAALFWWTFYTTTFCCPHHLFNSRQADTDHPHWHLGCSLLTLLALSDLVVRCRLRGVHFLDTDCGIEFGKDGGCTHNFRERKGWQWPGLRHSVSRLRGDEGVCAELS